jgi:CRP/FNR family transcriptional regulator
MESILYKIITYPQNSYIILEGEKKAQQFYIIKEGRVKLKKDFPVAGEKPSEIIGPGDFFGVVASMSQLPQIETAVSLTPVVLIGVSFTKFGELIQKNSPLALKIIRYFSKRLRQFDSRDTGIKASTSSSSPDNLNILLNLADYYTNADQKQVAIYMLQCYLKNLPSGEMASSAKEKLSALGASETMEEPTGSNQIFQDGQVVFCENEPGNDLYILQRGKVRITKFIKGNDVQLNVMNPGDIFGEMALLENKPRSASATAIEETELLVINKQNFEIMTEKQPQLMTRIITILSERIWNAYRKIFNSNLPDMNARILDMLMIILEKSKSKIGTNIAFDFNISFPELLKQLGISEDPEKVSKKILNMYKFLRLEDGILVCKDTSVLERQVSTLREKIKDI